MQEPIAIHTHIHTHVINIGHTFAGIINIPYITFGGKNII